MSAASDPRVRVDSYIVCPTGYEGFVNSDKDLWALTVVNGHAWGWSVRRGVGSVFALNRKGEWISESRGSGWNKPRRRFPLEEALSLALKHVDTLTVNGCTAAEASAYVASRIAEAHR